MLADSDSPTKAWMAKAIDPEIAAHLVDPFATKISFAHASGEICERYLRYVLEGHVTVFARTLWHR